MVIPRSDRVVIVHAHLFKNAGSTLDWSLHKHFGPRFCDHRDDVKMRGHPEFLSRYLAVNETLDALSSHWLPLPAPSPSRLQLLPVTFLRDPLERMASVYAFERRQDVDHPGTRRARNFGFKDYVHWRLDEGVGPVMRNYQVRMLSGVYPGNDIHVQYEQACDNLRAFCLVGLVEHYERSVVLFEQSLREFFPSIDLAYLRQNVSDRDDARSPVQRRTAVEDQLGELLEDAIAANRADMDLHQLFTERLEQRWTALPDGAACLNDFRRRCDALAHNPGTA